MKNRFATADKLLSSVKALLNNGFVEIATASFDKLNVIQTKTRVKMLYTNIREKSKKMFLKVMAKEYARTIDELFEIGFINRIPSNKIDSDYIEDWLDEYDPVTRYRFFPELERKQLRFAEEVITAHEFRDRAGLRDSVVHAQKLVNGQLKEYLTSGVIRSHVQAMKDNGVHRVRWLTQKDEKVCPVCGERDGKIYRLSDIPTRHYNCRCWLEPID